MEGVIAFICFYNKRLSSHMDQIRQHINKTNRKIHSHDPMIEMVVNLVSKKVDKNDDSSPKFLIYRIVY